MKIYRGSGYSGRTWIAGETIGGLMGFELEFVVHLFVWTRSCGFYLFIWVWVSTLKIKNKNSYVVHVCVIDILS